MPLTSSVLTLPVLADIVAHMAHACRFADEPPLVLLAKLTEETGELARAICAQEGIARARDTASASLPDELADCAILLLRLAASYGVDLGAAMVAKCAANERRYA